MTRGPLLVTGGSGMLGRAVRRLRPDAVFVSSQECDLRDPGQVVNLFDRVRPAEVIHLAARVGGVKANAQWNVELLESNVQINASVLSVARQCRVRRLIAILSSCAFPLYDERSSTETDLHAQVPYQANLGYAFAKRYLDVHVRLVAKEEGVAWSTLAPVTMYGPHDNVDLEKGHVIGSLIHRCWLAKRNGGALTVWGSGEAVRQFVFVDDVARLIISMLGQPSNSDTVIVAPDEGLSIRSLAEAIARAMQFQGPIHFDTSQPEGVRIKRLESRRFEQAFPRFAFTSLEDGLTTAARWFVSTQPSVERQDLASPTGRQH